MDTPTNNDDTVDTFATIPDVPIRPANNIVNPNQVRSGMQRGAPVVNYGADGNPQVLQGNQATFGNGFFVAKPGFNVITNTDPSNLSFNSNQNAFKIVDTDTVDLPFTFVGRTNTSGFETQLVSVTHSLGYPPIVVTYTDNGTSSQVFDNLPYGGFTFSTGVQQVYYGSVTPTATNIIFGIYRNYCADATHTAGGLTGTIPLRYYILQETASVT